MSTTAPARRVRFLELVLERIGAPYVWGAKGEKYPDPEHNQFLRCYDCSGLVTDALREAGGPDWRATHRSTDLYRKLPFTEAPQPGDLCLYGPGGDIERPAVHVVVYFGERLPIVGANGGTSDTRDIATAREHRACVRPDARGPRYRRDFLGYRSLSQYLQE